MRTPRRRHPLYKGLTDVQRKVLYLRVERGLSFRQIAKELKFSAVSTVFQHYRYALAKARAHVGKVPIPVDRPAVDPR